MKKYIIWGLIIGFTQVSAFGWGLTSIFNNTTNTKPAQQTVSAADYAAALLNIQQQTQEVDKSVQNSFIDIVSNLSSQQDSNNFQNKLNSILSNSTTSQSQKNDLVSMLMSSYMTGLTTTNKTNTISNMQNLTLAQKISLANDLATLAQSGQQYTSLAKQSVETATNMMKAASKAKDTINTIRTINQTTQELKNKAQTTINVINKVKQLSALAGLSF